jgi:hypothetical protein
VAMHFLKLEIKRLLQTFSVPRPIVVPGEIDSSLLAGLVDEILSFYQYHPPFYDEATSDSLRISGTWKSILTERRVRQLKAIAESDAEAYGALLRNLFTSELMSGLWNYSSRIDRGLSPDFIREIHSLQVETGLDLGELCVGTPYPSAWGLGVPGHSPHVISHVAPSHARQAMHIIRALESNALWAEETKAVVLDLGSGFGGMAHYLLNLTEMNFDMILLDIPLNLTTAYAYLRVTNPGRRVVLVKTREEIKMLSEETPRPLEKRVILIPSIFAADIALYFPPSLLHNAQSLSEMSRVTIEMYLRNLVTQATRFVIESNVSNRFVTSNAGHVEVGSGEIAGILSSLGMSLVSRNIRDTGARYVVSTYVR